VLSKENEELLRELCGDTLPQETVDRLVIDLTDEEFFHRLGRLLDNIDDHKSEHPLSLRLFRRKRRG